MTVAIDVIAPRELPIIFSAPMVRALIAGVKTQTRRILKPQPVFAGIKSHARGHFAVCDGAWDFVVPTPTGTYTDNTHNGPWKCPYGGPGDGLWVRETWGINHITYGDVRASGIPVGLRDSPDFLTYRAHGEWRDQFGPGALDSWCPPWRPAIHMPRWASRINLGVHHVRVERLLWITRADILAEGVPSGAIDVHEIRDAILPLSSWASNPWVWVVEWAPGSVKAPRRAARVREFPR